MIKIPEWENDSLWRKIRKMHLDIVDEIFLEVRLLLPVTCNF